MLNDKGERILSRIVKIDNVSIHLNSDFLDIVTVGGWNVIAKRNQFKTGDYAVYIEIDAWVPTEVAPFLTKEGHEPHEYNGVKGERLKTIKLRGVVSQGLLLETSVLPDGIPLEEGYELDKILNIQKWELPTQGGTKIYSNPSGSFPSYIPKTDQERIQNIPELVLAQMFDGKNFFEVTEKLDGTSMTIFMDSESNLHVCSRNYDLKLEDDTFQKSVYGLWLKNNDYLVNLLKSLKLKNIAFQGELCGPGIQKNKYNLQEYKWFIFDIYDIKESRYMNYEERMEAFSKLKNYLLEYNISNTFEHVPFVSVVNTRFPSMLQWLDFAEGPAMLNMNIEREGVVYKCTTKPSISFKVINNKFLLKNGE